MEALRGLLKQRHGIRNASFSRDSLKLKARSPLQEEQRPGASALPAAFSYGAIMHLPRGGKTCIIPEV